MEKLEVQEPPSPALSHDSRPLIYSQYDCRSDNQTQGRSKTNEKWIRSQSQEHATCPRKESDGLRNVCSSGLEQHDLHHN